MNETEAWIHDQGPPPASIRLLLEALRTADDTEGPDAPSTALDSLHEIAIPFATNEEKARAAADFVATLDERIALAAPARKATLRNEPDDDDVDDPEPGSRPIAPGLVAGAAPSPAPTIAQPTMTFEAWAELSIRVLGAEAEEKLAALAAHGLTVEAWTRIDDGYLRVLSADLRAGRAERPALYEAACTAEMARRTGAQAPVGALQRATLAQAALPEAPAPLPMPAYVRAPAALQSTAESPNLPALVFQELGKMPFAKPAPAVPTAPGNSAPKTMQLPVMASKPNPFGGTLALAGNAIEQAVAALPFAATGTGTGAAMGTGTGSQAVASVVAFRELSVEQYVMLRVELAVRRDLRAATLERYGVPTEASFGALEAHWRRRIAGEPGVREAWEAARRGLMGWLWGELG